MKEVIKGCLCFFLLATPTMAQSELASIAAVVHEQIITSYDVNQRTKQLIVENRGKGTGDDYRQQALEELIIEVLLRRSALKMGHSVSKDDIEKHLSTIAQSQNTTLEKLIAFYESQGVSVQSLHKQIEYQLLRKILTLKLFSKKAEKFISPHHIKWELKNYERDQSVELNVQQIVFTQGSDKMQIAQNFRSKVVQKMNDGASFADIGTNISSKFQGVFYRNLGWQAETVFQDARLINLMLSLKSDSVAPAVELGNGKEVVLFYIKEKRIQTLPGVEPFRFDIATLSIRSSSDEQATTLVETLETTQREYDVCNENVALSSEVNRNFQRNLTIDSMTLKNRNAILAMNVGQSSKVSLVDNRNKGDGILAWMLVLCHRTGGIQSEEGREAAIKIVRQKLFNARLNSLMKNYLQDLRHRAYVKIR